MKKRKSTKGVKRVRHPMTRRRAIGTLAAGAGAMMVAGAATKAIGRDVIIVDEDEPGQFVSWNDGWAYLITGVTLFEGWWVVDFDDGRHAVDPAGWVHDSAVWYPIVETTDDGVWFTGDDGYEYLLEHDLQYFIEGPETA